MKAYKFSKEVYLLHTIKGGHKGGPGDKKRNTQVFHQIKDYGKGKRNLYRFFVIY